MAQRTFHRKASKGYVRCDQREFRVHTEDGKPFTGEVTVRLNEAERSAYAKHDVFTLLLLTEIAKITKDE